LYDGTAISNAANTGQTEFALGSTSVVTPSVPYQIINRSSSSGSSITALDQQFYQSLESNGILYSVAYCGTPAANDYPPIAYITALPNIASSAGSSGGCGYQNGIEFSVNAGGPGQTCVVGTNCQWSICASGFLGCTGTPVDASSPSATQEAVTAVLTAIKSAHPTWTWGDIKAALRQSASNWSTGYAASTGSGASTSFGFGNINYTTAVGYTNPATFYLQPPGFVANGYGQYAVFVLYPFQQTRRVGEVIYEFTSNPTSALATLTATNNNLTYSQVSALGGSLIYQSSGSPTNAQTFSWSPSSGSNVQYWFVAFTTDNATLASSNFSRGESFTILTETLSVSYSCLRQ
jgi:hypothetical protein